MARSEARVQTAIWDDDDFIALSPGAQRMYLLLVSQHNLNHAGLIPVTLKRWASKGGTIEDVERWLAELEQAGFILVDHDREELFVRSLIRQDKIYRQPQVMGAAVKDAAGITSPRLRLALAREVVRISQETDIPDGSLAHLSTLRGALPDPTGSLPAASNEADLAETVKPQVSSLPDACAQPQGMGSVTEVSTDSPPPIPKPHPQATVATTPQRADIEILCDQLADEIAANGSKRPPVTDRWRDAARLMLDRDKRDPTEAAGLIGWCQTDEFWRSNVLSMPTFREQYDRLRLQRQRAPAGPPPSRNTQILDAAMQRAQAAETQRGSNGRKAIG